MLLTLVTALKQVKTQVVVHLLVLFTYVVVDLLMVVLK